MTAENQPKGTEQRYRSMPPPHHILLILEEMEGKPLSTQELTQRLSERLTSRGSLLTKYVDIDSLVKEDLEYMERLSLVEREQTDEGEGVRISVLGSVMALALKTPANFKKNQ